jgi:[ribosomal protein S5]-alanine N-acetyltransferase
VARGATFEAGRLRYEPVASEHRDELSAMMRDPRVMRTLWPSAALPSEDQIRASLQAKIVHWERHGFGLWVLRERVSGDFVGRGGLQYTDTLGRRAVEAAWAVVPDRWNRGFATELARTSLEVGFNDLGLSEVIAFTLPDNLASRRVMEKTGFVYDGEISHAGLPHVLYRRRRNDAAPTARLTSTSRPPL